MASSSVWRSRMRFQRSEEDDPAMDDDRRSEAERSEDAGDDGAELESMTGKGIKRMCSELLELKKVSDEDFQRNVYSSYPTFIRIFEEVGGVESELMELEQLAMTQRDLVKVLASSLYAETLTYGLKDGKFEDLDLSSSSWFEAHMDDTLGTLDVLLLEHRLEKAQAVLEKETFTLKNLQSEENLSYPLIMSFTHALSERRTRLADQYALMAEHPRVAQPELQKLLSGLSRLGENHRANLMLLNFYRSRLQKSVHDMECFKPCLHGIYIRELAKVVFSAISQAAKSSVTLNGEADPYNSELIQWARAETETFVHNFCTYVKSISGMNETLSVAVEAVNSAVSFCSLLKSQNIILESKLMELIRPCMEEILQIHVGHLKEAVHMFTTTDNWVVRRFLILGVLRDKSSVTGFGDEVEYCLLTSSGRKFVALMQAIVDDISPLVTLGMGSSILKNLAELFNEYIGALERAITSKQNAEYDSPISYSAQTLKGHLSILVNSSTLLHFSSSIVGSVFKGITSSKNEPSSNSIELCAHDELDNWMLSIQDAAYQLQVYFCQQFVYGIMSHGDFYSGTCLGGWYIVSAVEDPMPSLAFQALFLQLRQLKELSKSIFVGMDELMEKLPTEIVKSVIVWVSKNQAVWMKTVELSCTRKCSCLEQVWLDIHFLMEIARVGGYFSDDLMVTALDLLMKFNGAFTMSETDPNGAVPDEGWAIDAARLAISKLLEAEIAKSEEEIAAISGGDLSTENEGNEYLPYTKNSISATDETTTFDVLINAVEDDDIMRSTDIEDMTSNSYEEQASGGMTNDYHDEDGTGADAGSHRISEIQDIMEVKVEVIKIKEEFKSVGKLDELDAITDQLVAGESQILVKANLMWGTELLGSHKFGELEAIEDLELDWLSANSELEPVGFVSETGILDAIAARLANKENLLELELPESNRLIDIEAIEQLEVGLAISLDQVSVANLDDLDAINTAGMHSLPSDDLVDDLRSDIEKHSLEQEELHEHNVALLEIYDQSNVSDTKISGDVNSNPSDSSVEESNSVEDKKSVTSEVLDELQVETSEEKLSSDGVDFHGFSRNIWSDSVRPRDERKRITSVTSEESSGKSWKGSKAPRRRWQ